MRGSGILYVAICSLGLGVEELVSHVAKEVSKSNGREADGWKSFTKNVGIGRYSRNIRTQSVRSSSVMNVSILNVAAFMHAATLLY